MQKNARAKGLKRKAIVWVKLVDRKAPKSIPIAIALLKLAGAKPERGPSTRKAVYNITRILKEAPYVGVKAMKMLAKIEKEHGLSSSAVLRIFGSPLAYTTIKGKMRALAHHEIGFDGLLRTFEELQKDVKLAYDRKIPEGVAGHVVECKRGEFYGKLIHFGAHYRAPKSYLTDMVVSRMEFLGMPESEIAEVERIKWGMHQQSHKAHEAKEKGNLEAAKKARKKVRELQSVLVEKFVKNL